MFFSAATNTLVVSTKPTTNGTVPNEWRIQFRADGGSVLWRWSGSAWAGIPLSDIVGAGAPATGLTSDCAGQVYQDTTNHKAYYAAAAGSTTWTAIARTSGGGGGGSP